MADTHVIYKRIRPGANSLSLELIDRQGNYDLSAGVQLGGDNVSSMLIFDGITREEVQLVGMAFIKSLLLTAEDPEQFKADLMLELCRL